MRVTTVRRGVGAKLGDEARASCFAEGRDTEPAKTVRASGDAGRAKGKDTELKRGTIVEGALKNGPLPKLLAVAIPAATALAPGPEAASMPLST